MGEHWTHKSLAGDSNPYFVIFLFNAHGIYLNI